MIYRIVISSLLCALLWQAKAATSTSAEIKPTDGFKVERILNYQDIHAFSWDERGVLWFVSGSGNRLVVNAMPDLRGAVVEFRRSLERRGNERSGLLVNGNTVFVSDGDAIRRVRANADKSEDDPYVLPGSLFPAHSQITALYWAPLGPIYFAYHSSFGQESGIGRLDSENGRWDVVVKGISGNLAFDLGGFAIAADIASSGIFRLAPGLDYERGLETYRKSDLALRTGKPDLKPAFATIYSGSTLAATNRGTWLIFDSGTSSLLQFEEKNGGLKHLRAIAQVDVNSKLLDIQIGPDGAVWILTGAAANSAGTGPGAILRLEDNEAAKPSTNVKDVSQLGLPDLVAEFKSLNSWNRDAALRTLDHRVDLRATRGLHPGTPLHDAFRDKSNSPIARVYAALALHRSRLLDENLLEDAADDSEPLVRIWAGLLLGERNYPTGPAFHKIMKLAKETNIVVRSAAAVAARQFVSGSLAVDMPPRAMPIREVFTGGILSTLWFSTENGHTPEFDLLYWNAVRPISAFDHAHPMGFFNGDSDSKLDIAYWIVGLITRQIAESEDPLKQQDAMLMVGELKASNTRMILAALQGLKNGSPGRKVTPTQRSLQVLAGFAKSEDDKIAVIAKEILADWTRSFRE
jgi:hypothetical protein